MILLLPVHYNYRSNHKSSAEQQTFKEIAVVGVVDYWYSMHSNQCMTGPNTPWGEIGVHNIVLRTNWKPTDRQSTEMSTSKPTNAGKMQLKPPIESTDLKLIRWSLMQTSKSNYCIRINLPVNDTYQWLPRWWIAGARKQRAHHQHSSTPLAASKGNWERAFLALST